MRKVILHFILITFFLPGITNAQSWEEQAIDLLPLHYGIYDISVVDENIVWAVAFDLSFIGPVPEDHLIKVIKTIDGGENWTLVDLEEVSGRISFDIQAFDEDNAFVTAQDYGSGAGRGVFKTTDGGESWSSVFMNTAGGVWIRFFNANDGVVINRSSIATTEDGGETWDIVSSEFIAPYLDGEFTAITTGNNSCEVRGDCIWFGTSKNRVYRSKDKGKTWDAFNASFLPDDFITSVAFKDSLNGLTLNASADVTIFSRTTDGGETWTTLPVDSGLDLHAIEYIPGTEGTFMAFSGANSFPEFERVSAYSVDFGISWIIIDSNIGYGATDFISPYIGWTSIGRVTGPEQTNMYKWVDENLSNPGNQDKADSFNTYPNPFIDYITITNTLSYDYQKVEYVIYNHLGQMTYSGIVYQNDTVITVPNLEKGVYYLHIITDEGNFTKKMIKVN